MSWEIVILAGVVGFVGLSFFSLLIWFLLRNESPFQQMLGRVFFFLALMSWLGVIWHIRTAWHYEGVTQLEKWGDDLTTILSYLIYFFLLAWIIDTVFAVWRWFTGDVLERGRVA